MEGIFTIEESKMEIKSLQELMDEDMKDKAFQEIEKLVEEINRNIITLKEHREKAAF